jgi:hypothetical protein
VRIDDARRVVAVVRVVRTVSVVHGVRRVDSVDDDRSRAARTPAHFLLRGGVSLFLFMILGF